MQFLRDSYKSYAHKHIPDGLLFDIDYLGRKPKPNSILHALCKKHDLDFSEWGRKKTHGSIPIYTAMGLLAYAIKDIRSNFTNFVTDYYAVLRLYKNKLGSDFRYYPNMLFDLYPEWVERGFDDPHKILGKASSKGSENSEIIRREYYKCKRLGIAFDYKACHKKFRLKSTSNVTKDILDRSKSCWDISYDFCNDFYEVVSKYLKTEKARYINHGKIKDHIVHVIRPAVLIIFLCLTGARSWSEIRHLRRKDVTLDSDSQKKARFTTPIKKTNHGIREERDAFNLVSEAAQCIHVCRMEISKEQYLFSNTALGLLFTGTQYKPEILSSGRLTDTLKSYYEVSFR
jgi:integrase